MTEELDLTATNPYLAPGVHLWKVDKAEKGVSRTSGKDKITVNFSRDDNPQHKMTDHLSLSPGAFDGTKQKLQALLGPDFRGSYADACFQMIGAKVYVSTEVNEFNGRTGLRPIQNTLTHNGYQPFVEDGPAPAGYEPPEPTPF